MTSSPPSSIRAVREAWLLEQELRHLLSRAVQQTGETLTAARDHGEEWGILQAQMGGVSRQTAHKRLTDARERLDNGGGLSPDATQILAAVRDALHGRPISAETAPTSTQANPSAVSERSSSVAAAARSDVLSAGDDAKQRLRQAAHRGADRSVDAEQRRRTRDGLPPLDDVAPWRDAAIETARGALNALSRRGIAMGDALVLVEDAAATYTGTSHDSDSPPLP